MVRDTIPSKKKFSPPKKNYFFRHRKFFFKKFFDIFQNRKSKSENRDFDRTFQLFRFLKKTWFQKWKFWKIWFLLNFFFRATNFFFGVDNFFKVQLRCKNSSSFDLWGFQDDSGTPSGRTDSFCTCEIRFRAYGQLLYSIEIYYRKSAKSIFAKNGMKNSKISNNHEWVFFKI